MTPNAYTLATDRADSYVRAARADIDSALAWIAVAAGWLDVHNAADPVTVAHVREMLQNAGGSLDMWLLELARSGVHCEGHDK